MWDRVCFMCCTRSSQQHGWAWALAAGHKSSFGPWWCINVSAGMARLRRSWQVCYKSQQETFQPCLGCWDIWVWYHFWENSFAKCLLALQAVLWHVWIWTWNELDRAFQQALGGSARASARPFLYLWYICSKPGLLAGCTKKPRVLTEHPLLLWG